MREVRSFAAGCQIVHHSCGLSSLSGADGGDGGGVVDHPPESSLNVRECSGGPWITESGGGVGER